MKFYVKYNCSGAGGTLLIASKYSFRSPTKKKQYYRKKLSKRSCEYREVRKEFKRTCESAQIIEV